MRTVRVPWRNRWLERVNKRFAIDKSHYDGWFTSRLGPGYCVSGPVCQTMLYVFLDVPGRTERDLRGTVRVKPHWLQALEAQR